MEVSSEELLASAPVPASSPARLIALSRAAMLVVKLPAAGRRRGSLQTARVQVQRYEQAGIFSARHSPVLAWFLPLFTPLRQTLRAPWLYEQGSGP